MTFSLPAPIFRETGIKMKLHTRSHGILATIRGGGHIEHIAPLFKSESPSQVRHIKPMDPNNQTYIAYFLLGSNDLNLVSL